MSLGSDIDWICRANDAGINVQLVEEVLLFRRVHQANAWRLESRTGDSCGPARHRPKRGCRGAGSGSSRFQVPLSATSINTIIVSRLQFLKIMRLVSEAAITKTPESALAIR